MRYSIIAASAAVTLFALPVQAGTAVYDLTADWSPTNNPNGTWSYLQGTTPLSYQSSVSALSGAAGFAPGPNYGNFLPLVWMGSGEVLAHSVDGSNGTPANGELVLTWTAPSAGTIDISGYMYYAHPGQSRSNDFALALGTTTLASGTVSYMNAYDAAHKLAFSFADRAVSAGDVLSLTLQRSAGQQWGTVAAMNWHVVETTAPIPEPETYAMMIAGLGLLGLMARRKKSA